MEKPYTILSEKQPCVIAVSGVKNSGKTTLIERLLPELKKRGIRVATIKHDAHLFEADRPGTDSYRHLQAGAVGAAVFDREKYQLSIYRPVDELTLIDQFPNADLILLEGFKDSAWPKIEIVRKDVSERMVCDPTTLLALVTDREDLFPVCPVFGITEILPLAEFLFQYIQKSQKNP